MDTLQVKYKGTIVFATRIQDNLVSVDAQIDSNAKVVRNIYKEIIYKTDNVSGALNCYIKNYLSKEIKEEE